VLHRNILCAGTPLIQQRPFRAPHHTISHAGLVGCGNFPRPGEISRDYRGVLFLSAMSQLQLSARAVHQVLKLARTIPDLAGSDAIQPAHLA
jgi:magnesium chelatase family protein